MEFALMDKAVLRGARLAGGGHERGILDAAVLTRADLRAVNCAGPAFAMRAPTRRTCGARGLAAHF